MVFRDTVFLGSHNYWHHFPVDFLNPGINFEGKTISEWSRNDYPFSFCSWLEFE
jgi:hypothetical protein